ncbi:MAG: hypothetical protein ACXU8U_10425 [Asticcacaulis sp.]
MTNLTMDVMGGLKKRLVDNGDGTFAELIAVEMSGSTGKDYSVNAPALPNVGANFAASGPYASYVLVKTVAANATRNAIEIGNATGAQIAIVRDDGTAVAATAPVNASVFPIAGGASAGQQGGDWTSTTFRGRLQIYAPAALSGNAFITVMED